VALESAATEGKRLKKGRRVIYKVTTDSDVVNTVAVEAPKTGWRRRWGGILLSVWVAPFPPCHSSAADDRRLPPPPEFRFEIAVRTGRRGGGLSGGRFERGSAWQPWRGAAQGRAGRPSIRPQLTRMS
jgi:hypothetical protein